MPNLLLVEDDANLGSLLQEYLIDKGFPTDLATDGQKGWQSFVDKTYDLCIFDVMMPKKDGFSLAKEVRMSGRDVPIIFLTAKSMKEDTMQGFRVGADDYVTKPFDREELLLRIEAILRRYKKQPEGQEEAKIYQVGQYSFDYSHQQLSANDKSVRLTSKESELLKLFCQNLNQPISRSFALKTIWGDDSYFNARSMDVYITKLRKYLREDTSIQIMNLHGEGFKLMVG
ncbi:response regulator transcription factor [Dyadobacter chenwenxiniae]|uniref:Response regulator transcription factor n=1 Tax=Dyadobacter chenwenxiniae TaxID=2906456 RepID=A0A9X1PTN9_9BACT|nr:response regulator transcription factor [Dyadobacter chenwenxiniae]MCF0051327.1 response regulator transcription factor [Dyadobacter chenwenxiniae]MCF0065433.1 response regulator transcription factor [Dyadobacter chenwenxiniae]UON82158.1 response regulator transcription factor [Dyadobacter chenwenxiniae]